MPSFLNKHGNSDFAKHAKKLQETPKIVLQPKLGIPTNIGIKTGPVIPVSKRQWRGIKTGGLPINNGNGGIGGGIKTGPIVNNGNNPVLNNGNTGINGGIKPGTPIINNGQNGNGQNGTTGIGTKIGTPIPTNGNTGINGGIKPGTVITTNGKPARPVSAPASRPVR